MNIFHRELVSCWNNLSIFEQMANIGAEIGRAISWQKKNNPTISKKAFYRALELIDFTVDDSKNLKSLKEILRLREVLVDYFAGSNQYHSAPDSFEKYFYYFNLACRKNK